MIQLGRRGGAIEAHNAKKEDIQTLREMLSESLAAQHAMKESFEEDKASFVTKSGKITHC